MNPEEEITPILIPILYRDEEILVVNKPAFMMVHPWKGGPRKEKALMTWVKEQTGEWVYPVHRLDRQSSGAVLFTLKPEHVTFYQDRWHSDEVKKKYLALASGHFTEKAGEYKNQLKTPRGHKQDAHSLYRCLGGWQSQVSKVSEEGVESLVDLWATLCEVEIKTGRKHQIRRHFSRHMHALIGDARYGKGYINDYFRHDLNFPRLFLHSHYLKIPHPTENEVLELSAPLFPELKELLAQLQISLPEL